MAKYVFAVMYARAVKIRKGASKQTTAEIPTALPASIIAAVVPTVYVVQIVNAVKT